MNEPIGLNAQGRVAVLTALQKTVKAELEKARAEADKEMYELYEGFGTDRAKILLAGTEVGTISLRFPSDAYHVVDKESFEEFCLLNGLASIRRSIRPEYMVEVVSRIADDLPAAIAEEVVLDKDAAKMFQLVGDVYTLAGTDEVIPGIEPAPKAPVGTTVRGCDPKLVMPALQALPGAVDALLLGGVSDE